MNWIWLFSALLISALGVTGCSSTEKDSDALDELQLKQEKSMRDFAAANRLLDDGDYEKAAVAYDRLLVDNPTDQLDMVVLYNAGLAHLQAGDCVTAGERLRKMIRISKKNYPTIAGRALLRMGDVYTCLGEDNKSITNLVEIYHGKYKLPDDIVFAEAPAKLAAAYARIGNGREAEKYFKAAERGLIRLQKDITDPYKRIHELSRVLFMMGNILQINTSTMASEDYLSTIRALQKYLYKSVELDTGSWSKQSYQQIMHAYVQAWDYINKVPQKDDTDKTLSERSQQMERLRVAQTALQNIQALFNERIPDPDEPEIVTSLLSKMKVEETKFRNYIATNIVGTSLTKEALAAEGVRRAGKTLNPDPILESKAKKSNSPGKAN